MEEKVSAMQRWTPDQQIDHVTELLVQSNVGLLVAIAAQDLPGIAEAKRKAATIQEIAKQLHISKEMQSHAAEFVRRAERGLGVGIREAQARGEVETCNEGKARGSLVRDQVVTYDKVKPKPTDFASKHELTNTHGGIYDLADGVSDEQFEEAITEARAEGKLRKFRTFRSNRGATCGHEHRDLMYA
ncbi:hypothetical protein [Mycobacteroides abscessus]|uniref:hypothetical protein n=1 Tax=Mycobacteroides abscessus TaxID=36809 RepID=UPI000698ED25|nr:hypothetical protein [Mycobacteroides abscessus]